jgi:transposase
MTAPLSNDLRLRIVKAHHAKEGSYAELAARFNVGEASISRVLRVFRERGDVEPLGHGGGQPPKISAEQYPALRKLVAEKPDRNLQQLCHAWAAHHGVRVSVPAMHRTLKKAGLSWKKNGSVRPSSFARTSKRAVKHSLKR